VGWQVTTSASTQRLDPMIQDMSRRFPGSHNGNPQKDGKLRDPEHFLRSQSAESRRRRGPPVDFRSVQELQPASGFSFDTYATQAGVPFGIGNKKRDGDPAGQDRSDRWIIIGGTMIRSTTRYPRNKGDPQKSVEIDAPGVSDNGSGLAATMECARV